ncbi:MAG TPA: type II toxin-antitoxin system VapC family toxin [Candidatus Saccharimonadales bacterium]|jgi:tRNA(fMet)-specific endonuclease VapC|nr:type II toxin-antitoxin system VapC family toxin [Candidatus Saccharimonadales bacterium]
MNYLLDTNACIALMSPNINPVQKRFARASRKGAKFFVPSVVAFELWYGVFKSARQQENARRCEMFFAGPLEMLSFQDADAKIAGQLRAALESAGKPIGAYDLLIAGQAVRHKLTLITANVSEFSRIKELVWDDWSK